MEMGMPKATTSRGKGQAGQASRAGSQAHTHAHGQGRVRSAPSPHSPVVFGSARAILRGEMDKIGLCTLLTILEMERRTGILVLQRRRQLGRLHVRDGQIIRARIEGQGRQAGPEAIYQMLTWVEGQFELWQAEVEGLDEIRLRTAYLLMEGMRRQDEGTQMNDGVGDGVGDGASAPVAAPGMAAQTSAHTIDAGDFRVAF
jgi:hypothetical protein